MRLVKLVFDSLFDISSIGQMFEESSAFALGSKASFGHETAVTFHKRRCC